LAARYGGEPLSIQMRKRSTSSACQGLRKVLAHDPVLEHRGLVEHVDQRLAVLDHERRLWDVSLDLVNVRY
jgi:predicted exporter